jgi:hypothetical protein
MKQRALIYKLGFANGKIMEEGGTFASYFKPMTLLPVFKVRVADVTGFVVTKAGMSTVHLRILGNGTELVSAEVPAGAAEKIEGWFRSHPGFGGGAGAAPAQAYAPPAAVRPSIAAELSQLASLRDQGVLTEAEFNVAKAKLLA